MWQQPAACVLDREILLMVAHHCYQDFLGQFQKFLVKASENYRGKFGKVDDRVEEILIFTPTGAGNRAGSGIQRFANLLLALAPAQDLCSAQGFEIRRTRARNLNGLVRQEPVPSRLPPGTNAIK